MTMNDCAIVRSRVCNSRARALLHASLLPVLLPFVRVFGKQLRAVEVSIVHGSC